MFGRKGGNSHICTTLFVHNVLYIIYFHFSPVISWFLHLF